MLSLLCQFLIAKEQVACEYRPCRLEDESEILKESFPIVFILVKRRINNQDR